MDVLSKFALKLSLVFAFASFSIPSINLSGAPRPHVAEPEAATPVQPKSGATIYSQNCARCHGVDGRAQTAKGKSVGASDLTSDDWIPDTARDIRLVTRGKEEMPSFKAKLKPAEIEAVVSYIRRFKR